MTVVGENRLNPLNILIPETSLKYHILQTLWPLTQQITSLSTWIVLYSCHFLLTHTLSVLPSLVTTHRPNMGLQSNTPRLGPGKNEGDARESGGRMVSGGVDRMLRLQMRLSNAQLP